MVFQQFGGINGIGFYASQTFTEAGKKPVLFFISFEMVFDSFYFPVKTYFLTVMLTAGLSSTKVGTIAYGCVQVFNSFTFL